MAVVTDSLSLEKAVNGTGARASKDKLREVLETGNSDFVFKMK